MPLVVFSFLNVDITNLIPAVHCIFVTFGFQIHFWTIHNLWRDESEFTFQLFFLIDAQADSALDCCLKVSSQVIPKHVVLSYRNQIRGIGCTRDAVV